jgi:hypothetical protein
MELIDLVRNALIEQNPNDNETEVWDEDAIQKLTFYAQYNYVDANGNWSEYIDDLYTSYDMLKFVDSNSHVDGNDKFEYCNAAEQHVRREPTHVVTVARAPLDPDLDERYAKLKKASNPDWVDRIEVRCVNCGWWDHVGPIPKENL